MANKIAHFEIPADETGKLKEFYESTFDWKVAPMPGSGGSPMGEYLMIDTGDGNLGGGMMKRQAPEHMVTMYIDVDDIDEHIEKVKANGGKIIVEKGPVPGMGWFCNFLDPQNNCFGLWQADPNAK